MLIALAGLVAGAANWGLSSVQEATAEKEAAQARILRAQEVARNLAEMAYAASSYTATAETTYRDRYRELEAAVAQGIQELVAAAADDQEARLVGDVQSRFAEFSAFVGRVLERDRFNDAEVRWMSRSLQNERNRITTALNDLLAHLERRGGGTAHGGPKAAPLAPGGAIGSSVAAAPFRFGRAFL
nr:MAG: hypothetical protein DIU55_12385 [Bacillota bacterium]